MSRWKPAALIDPSISRPQLGMVEIFLGVLPNGRSLRSPRFRPMHELWPWEQKAVLDWARRWRPDLLPADDNRRS